MHPRSAFRFFIAEWGQTMFLIGIKWFHSKHVAAPVDVSTCMLRFQREYDSHCWLLCSVTAAFGSESPMSSCRYSEASNDWRILSDISGFYLGIFLLREQLDEKAPIFKYYFVLTLYWLLLPHVKSLIVKECRLNRVFLPKSTQLLTKPCMRRLYCKAWKQLVAVLGPINVRLSQSTSRVV